MVQSVFLIDSITISADTGLVYDALAVLITETGFIYGISATLFGSFAIIHGFQTVGSDGGYRVAHPEEHVNGLVTDCQQICLVTRFSLISDRIQSHFGFTGIDPDEFPIELQFIRQTLTRLDGFILGSALCCGREYSQPNTTQYSYH
jgi:hypothetical protein